jgi:argininosuccinate lyase
MPLGSGALAGSGFPVNRDFLADKLGFEKPSQNSIDATAHRDIPTEAAFTAALISVHLSRYTADLIIWSSREYNFIALDDAFATGSSIMPQKKNPDSLELIRGKAATAIGHLTGLLTLCHGLPHAYNRDLQEDKKQVFEILDIAISSLEIFTGVLKSLKINKEIVASALTPDLLATELADYLTISGINFRKAHNITGEIVKWAEQQGIPLTEIPLKRLKEFSSCFDNRVCKWLNFENALKRRNIYGGTGPESVKTQLTEAKKAIETIKESYQMR